MTILRAVALSSLVLLAACSSSEEPPVLVDIGSSAPNGVGVGGGAGGSNSSQSLGCPSSTWSYECTTTNYCASIGGMDVSSKYTCSSGYICCYKQVY